MISSMTGYGRAMQTIDNFEITAELKSVNHRFFDFSLRAPKSYGYLDEQIKKYLNTKISRGKLDVYISIINNSDESVELQIDKPLLAAYVKALKSLKDEYDLSLNLSAVDLLNEGNIFKIKKTEENAAEMYEKVITVLDVALDDYLSMRIVEGETLKLDIIKSISIISQYIEKITEFYPKIVENYQKKLADRIALILEDKKIEQDRILIEAAIFADKTAVNEELVRLKSHISQMEKMLEENNPIGKKLDFIIQEMNREVNTIGSKANDVELTNIVVQLKSEIEKIREQIQNIE